MRRMGGWLDENVNHDGSVVVDDRPLPGGITRDQ